MTTPIREVQRCTVRRVTAPDTLAVEILCPASNSRAVTYVRLFGVDCEDSASAHIMDWVELYGRTFELLVMDWMRDKYGRLVGDLADHGETLTDYLLSVGAATARPAHWIEVVQDALTAQEPAEPDDAECE